MDGHCLKLIDYIMKIDKPRPVREIAKLWIMLCTVGSRYLEVKGTI